MIYQKEELFSDINNRLDVMAVCMLLTRKILSINNVKDNLLFLQKK